MDCSPPGSSILGDSSGKNTGVGCHYLLQKIFPTQGLNPGHLHCRWILYHLSHQDRKTLLKTDKSFEQWLPGPERWRNRERLVKGCQLLVIRWTLSRSSVSGRSKSLLWFFCNIVWERLRAGGEGGNREWDGWVASFIQWTWLWANSGR